MAALDRPQKASSPNPPPKRPPSLKDTDHPPPRDAALVLRLNPVGESDVLVDLFTACQGRATALAKGGKRSQKRFFGLLLWGHLLEVDLAPTKSGGGLQRLEAASLLSPFAGLRDDYQRVMAAGPVMELLLRASAPMDPHPRALELAIHTLSRMEEAASIRELASLLLIYQARLLREFGYGLELGCCLHCGKKHQTTDPVCLSLEGGLVCGDCSRQSGAGNNLEAPAGLIKGLCAALEMEGDAALARLGFPRSLTGPGLTFLGRFWQQIAGHDLPSLGLAAHTLTGA